MDTIFITSGVGFIGRHVSRTLLNKGYEVKILDPLIEQVHQGERPVDLPTDVELIVGDIRDELDPVGELSGV